MAKPRQEVIDAIEAGVTTTTRRVEFYESDGTTPWYPDSENISRLIDGSVSVDYGRAERRSLDITLDNEDNALRPDPENGLWYDKVLKTFRGVKYPTPTTPPRVAIIESEATADSWEIRDILLRLGYTDVTIEDSITTFAEVVTYDILVGYMKTTAITKDTVYREALANGVNVFINSPQSSDTEWPELFGATSSGSQTFNWTPADNDNPLQGGWSGVPSGGPIISGNVISAVASGAILVARKPTTTQPMAVVREFESGSRIFYFLPPAPVTSEAKLLWANALQWLRNYTPYRTWETQLGEFVIDNISESRWPYQTKLTGRDYTKRCLVSKLEQAMQFDASTPISTFIRSLASNAGITKFKMPTTSETIGRGMTFDRGTERWNVMKKAADANNYELYFDSHGYLTMRKYYDPTTSPFSQTFKTGADGNLVSWDRSTNDSRLYNHIIVTGESADSNSLPYFGEAKNEEPSSPTRINRIGDRSYFYTSSFFTNDQQCQDLALRWLKEKALESYEISWTSLNYPWLEVGEIVEFLDPRRADQEPTRFLMDTLSIPLGLGPMSATGKRVTYVNDPGLAAA